MAPLGAVVMSIVCKKPLVPGRYLFLPDNYREGAFMVNVTPWDTLVVSEPRRLGQPGIFVLINLEFLPLPMRQEITAS